MLYFLRRSQTTNSSTLKRAHTFPENWPSSDQCRRGTQWTVFTQGSSYAPRFTVARRQVRCLPRSRHTPGLVAVPYGTERKSGFWFEWLLRPQLTNPLITASRFPFVVPGRARSSLLVAHFAVWIPSAGGLVVQPVQECAITDNQKTKDYSVPKGAVSIKARNAQSRAIVR